MERDGNRTLIGQRLNQQATPLLRVSISETTVLSCNPSPLFYWPFPEFPVYALQHLINQQDHRPGNDANVHLGMDFSLMLGQSSEEPNGRAHGAELYSEILIDDAQSTLSRRSRVPDYVGALIGLDIHRQNGKWQVSLNRQHDMMTGNRRPWSGVGRGRRLLCGISGSFRLLH
ncbi:MAG: hypothetical protein VB144_04675 [Clostridia bacterium]|nr:hypothetical protein [Clostridia bacterium]